ncbi:Calmodulin [Chlorella sorokiniana]|jgi:calmodulin|uniref:Calmodulin n=1 Tax=Chlorella sorokiniana TaxID=3076 RepID=A0A2P6TPD2_CHLSO|nr:Calmodulin [Chlorella sorokiniana]|eukprot:PRW55898.1 Calmodulin [Chlorella sorokiniana]
MADRGQQRRKALREVFDMFDKDGSGTIDVHELRAVLRALGQFPTAAELADLMQRMDANQDGSISFDEFAAAMAGQAEDEETEQQLREIREVFSMFDTDHSGTLCATELQRALRILGVDMTCSEVALLISEVDADGDGEISCDELLTYVLQFEEGGSAADGPAGGKR